MIKYPPSDLFNGQVLVQSTRVLQTKINPPRKSTRTLSRLRVLEALNEAINHRLTVLQAGAGYGKSTALAELTELHQPVAWYQVTEDDNDALVFLLHLFHATQRCLPALVGLPIPVLESWSGSRSPLPVVSVLDQYLNELSNPQVGPVLLVLDDVHLVIETAEIAHLLDRLIGLAPANLHVVLSSRPPVKLPNLTRWQAHGEVLTLDQSLLAFNVNEISALFGRHYQYELTHDEAEMLFSTTEGWAIALQLIWQSLRSNASATVEDALVRQAESLESLFDILTLEVFDRQPQDIQDFLKVSSILREMTSESCDALRDSQDSASMLAFLRRQELFVLDLGSGNLRYHHIFHNFLRQQMSPEQCRSLHLRAGEFFLSRQDMEGVLYHFLQAQDSEGVASVLDIYGNTLLNNGRLDTLAFYLDTLPPETLREHPALLSLLGDLARLHSRFQEALGWYQQAEAIWRGRGHREGIGRALRGQASVYIDTVNPNRAEELLQQALRMSDGIEDRQFRARLYELLAENKLNYGQVEEAETLSLQAESLRNEGPSDSQLTMRVLLRTGRLQEARQKLRAMLEAERQEPIYTPRSHRETVLVLSLVSAFMGLPEEAYHNALEGTHRGMDLHSPFVTAVGHMRQGHALMLRGQIERFDLARQQFEKAIEISRSLDVPRLRVEALWGLARVYGYQGDLAKAVQVADEGIKIATLAGDEWIASLTRLAAGAGLLLFARYEAASEWLNQAIAGFMECSDPFGESAARVWLCLGWYRQKDFQSLAQVLPAVLSACLKHGYDYLFTSPTLLGPPDERALTPLLLLARDHDWEAGYANRLLAKLGIPDATIHPGYQLRVYTLGSFKVSHGDQVISNKSWRREKSRQLFQLLLTHRAAPLDRDQVIEHLWPGLDPATAQRNFKVTLNTLYHVLEPEREPGSESAYIIREGTTYGMRPGMDLWLDTDAFCSALACAANLSDEQPALAATEFERALQFYQGEYLPEARYEVWAAAERERLAVLFLRSADRLSELYIQEARFQEAIDLSQRILGSDNCWERAYRHQMLAYHRLGDRGQVARTYQRCMQTLRKELDVAPAPETETLYTALTGGQSI
jgi:LuxR family transcriptional regulator, maltose regulon positive regulatory protein